MLSEAVSGSSRGCEWHVTRAWHTWRSALGPTAILSAAKYWGPQVGIWNLNLDSPKVTELVKVLIGRGYFSSFRAIFRGFSQFRGFSSTDFPFFDAFPIFDDGILEPRR
jgi:hypothetical protein